MPSARTAGRAAGPTVSRAAITEAALAVLDAEGDISMRKIAARLGVAAPSLYYRVAGKAEVVDLIRESVMADVPEASAPGWRADAIGLFSHLSTVYAQHPALAALFARTPIASDLLLDRYERLATSLADAGASPEQTALVLEILESYTLGIGLEHTAPTTVWHAREEDEALAASIAAIEHRKKLQQAFDVGFTMLLDGLDARLRRTRYVDPSKVVRAEDLMAPDE